MAKKILVIEDDPYGRKLLHDYLVAKGYDVECATNGVEGLERARETQPDLVVCDVILPRKSGFEVCFDLKRPTEERRPPVLLMSAILEGEGEQRYASDLQADGMFVKPFSMKTMLERIEQLLAS